MLRKLQTERNKRGSDGKTLLSGEGVRRQRRETWWHSYERLGVRPPRKAAAGTGADVNWNDLGGDATEPGITGSGVDWELVEVCLAILNMVAAATVMQHVDQIRSTRLMM